MKTVKNFRSLLTIIFIVSIVTLLFAGINATNAYAHSDEQFADGTMEMLGASANVADLLNGREAESTGYLFNYDDTTDYTYIDFKGRGGYAIFSTETGEMLEYTLSGDFPYTDTSNKMYYGGPSKYHSKRGMEFVNVVTNEAFTVSTAEAKSISSSMRKRLSAGKKANSASSGKMPSVTAQGGDKNPLSSPPLDEGSPISPTAGATYISNSEYFLTSGAAPRHGQNNGESCVAVASQLLLSYNNY